MYGTDPTYVNALFCALLIAAVFILENLSAKRSKKRILKQRLQYKASRISSNPNQQSNA